MVIYGAWTNLSRNTNDILGVDSMIQAKFLL